MLLTHFNDFWPQKLTECVCFCAQKTLKWVSKVFWPQKLTLWVSFWVQKLTLWARDTFCQKLPHVRPVCFPLKIHSENLPDLNINPDLNQMKYQQLKKDIQRTISFLVFNTPFSGQRCLSELKLTHKKSSVLIETIKYKNVIASVKI